MLGRRTEFEKELAKRIGPDRARQIVRELGRDVVSSQLFRAGPEVVAETVGRMASFYGSEASARLIASEVKREFSKIIEEVRNKP
jgi:hypothetical protein